VQNLKERKDFLIGYRINIIVLIVICMLFRCVSETATTLNPNSSQGILLLMIYIGIAAVIAYIVVYKIEVWN